MPGLIKVKVDTVTHQIMDPVVKRAPDDSIIVKSDTTRRIDSLSLPDKDDADIKDKITYKAKDSIVYDIASKKMYLYNGAETHYEKIQPQCR